jgi:hypothetical protein
MQKNIYPVHLYTHLYKVRICMQAVPLTGLAGVYWMRDRYRYNRAQGTVTRVQWVVLLVLYPLWVLCAYCRGLQSARRVAAVVPTTAALLALGDVTTIAVMNDSPLRSRQQVGGMGVGLIEAYGMTAYDVFAYGGTHKGCRIALTQDDALAAGVVLLLLVVAWMRRRLQYNRAANGVTRAQWFVLLCVVPAYAFSSFVGGLQVARRHPALVLSVAAQTIGAHYSAVVVLNDAVVFSRPQAVSLVVTALLFYGWAAHDVIAYSSPACTS